jgi:hypothetical protein
MTLTQARLALIIPIILCFSLQTVGLNAQELRRLCRNALHTLGNEDSGRPIEASGGLYRVLSSAGVL